MTQLLASFERTLCPLIQIRWGDGPVSGRRYFAVCVRCGVRDQLSFTLRLSAESRRNFCECSWW